ncbi:unnamed protein product [marine sediment metagenome]|uniref:Uncharacterized protein n=1 Tax=marine sediment metagenome TaxID=412755 RepID=X1TL57_9ZZZZ
MASIAAMPGGRFIVSSWAKSYIQNCSRAIIVVSKITLKLYG